MERMLNISWMLAAFMFFAGIRILMVWRQLPKSIRTKKGLILSVTCFIFSGILTYLH